MYSCTAETGDNSPVQFSFSLHRSGHQAAPMDRKPFAPRVPDVIRISHRDYNLRISVVVDSSVADGAFLVSGSPRDQLSCDP